MTCLLASGCQFKFDRTLAPGEIIGTAVYRSATGALIPAVSATVTLENSGLSFTTDKHGAFALTGLPAGTFNVDVVDSPGGEVTGMVGLRLTSLAVSAGDGLDLGQIELQALGAIAGTVALDGNPVGPGAIAAISGLAQVPVTNGMFLFGVLLPGTYPVAVFYQDNPGVLVSPPTTIQVNPASTAQAKFSLSSQSMASAGAVQGLVQVSGASDNSNVDIQFSGGGPDLTTSASGTFASGGVPAGIYTVTASLGGFASVSVPDVLVGVGTAVVPNISLLPVAAIPSDGGSTQGSPPGCLVDSECPTGEVCSAGTCTGSTAGHDGGLIGCQQTGCVAGEICGANGACQPVGDGGMIETCYATGCSGTATCGIDGQCHPYPTGGTGASCQQLFDCTVVDCGLNSACASVCESEGSGAAATQFSTVFSCLGSACASDGGACLQNGVACNQCVSSAINGAGACVSQYDACEAGSVADGGAPSCVTTGCSSGLTCDPITGACTSGTAPPDAGANGETCAQILQCCMQKMCSLSDATCVQDCESGAGGHQQADFATLDTCLTGACSTADGGVCATPSATACQMCEANAAGGTCSAPYTTCAGAVDTDAGATSCSQIACPLNSTCDPGTLTCLPDGNTDGGAPGEPCLPLLNCVTAMSCVPSDATCQAACASSGSAEAQSQLSMLEACLNNACPSDADAGVCATFSGPCQTCENMASTSSCSGPYDFCTGASSTGDAGMQPCQVTGCPGGYTCQTSGICTLDGFGDGGSATADGGTTLTGCSEIIQCNSNCGTDFNCEMACVSAGTPTAQNEYNAVVTCVTDTCPPDGGDTMACDLASETDGGACAMQTAACVGATSDLPDAGPAAADAGSGSPPDAGGVCNNSLTFTGAPISTTTHDGGIPALVGGTPPAGVYSLTADDAYNGETSSSTEQWTLGVSGAHVQWASQTSLQPTVQYFEGTLAPQGTNAFTFTFTCPATNPVESFQYTTNSGILLVSDPIDPNLIHTFQILP